MGSLRRSWFTSPQAEHVLLLGYRRLGEGCHDLGAVPLGLVAYLGQQAGHAGVGEGLGLQSGPDHACDVQGFDTQGVVLADQGPADLMVRIASQSRGPAVSTVDTVLRLPPSPGCP